MKKNLKNYGNMLSGRGRGRARVHGCHFVPFSIAACDPVTQEAGRGDLIADLRSELVERLVGRTHGTKLFLQ